MSHRVFHLFGFGLLLLVGRTEGAVTENDFSAQIAVEGGAFQTPGGEIQPYVSSSLWAQSHKDLTSTLSLNLAGEIQWQSSGAGLPPSWPLYPVRNLLDLEAENLVSSNGNDFYSLRLSRVGLKWSSGRLDVSAGLLDFNWGSAYFYRPTDYFFPTLPLVWNGEHPLGSEGLDAKCFLFDDLSIETAVRGLEAGKGEWVIRLVDKDVAYAVVPSFARVNGRDGIGLECLVTFPDFQARCEGTAWLVNGASAVLEYTMGFSTVQDGATCVLEFFKDGTGNAVGSPAAAYLFASVEKPLPGEWKIKPALVKSLDGGPFLFWPKLSWGFAKKWEAAFQGQIKMGDNSGPMGLIPTKLGFSVSYTL